MWMICGKRGRRYIPISIITISICIRAPFPFSFFPFFKKSSRIHMKQQQLYFYFLFFFCCCCCGCGKQCFFFLVFRSFVRGVLLFLTNCHLEMMIIFLCMRITNQNTTTASYYAPLSLSIKRNNKWGTTCMEMKEIEPKTHTTIYCYGCW